MVNTLCYMAFWTQNTSIISLITLRFFFIYWLISSTFFDQFYSSKDVFTARFQTEATVWKLLENWAFKHCLWGSKSLQWSSTYFGMQVVLPNLPALTHCTISDSESDSLYGPHQKIHWIWSLAAGDYSHVCFTTRWQNRHAHNPQQPMLWIRLMNVKINNPYLHHNNLHSMLNFHLLEKAWNKQKQLCPAVRPTLFVNLLYGADLINVHSN